ncbi:MAG TPA: MMPL family transporter [Polyangiaceae bacterium]|nr:MMPL family transporter [Polyangiaceae bacterium]
MLRRLVVALVDASGRRPWAVVLVTLAFLAASWGYASRLELRTELRELLPRDSPGFQAYERQAGRVEGGATLFVLAESPAREQNERFIDELGARLEGERARRASCRAACRDEACRAACGPELIRYLETGSKDLQAFFARSKWLYAPLADLEAADEALEREIGVRSGLVVDLESDEAPAEGGGKAAGGAEGGGKAAGGAEGGGGKAGGGGSGLNADLRKQLDKLEQRPGGFDEFPSGYFETPDGRIVALRIVAKTAGLGDKSAARLLDEVRAEVERLNPKGYHPAMEVGYGGDIPNALAEQKSIASEALWATLLALTLVLGGVVFFYRSPWALVIIGLPAVVGVGAGYAFATAAFGYVNTVGAFLGAIVLGNGINYPIILLSRYRDFRARGLEEAEARRQAVLNAFRAELVGACVASIAYGSLTITRFRGFSQFGLIGFVGMLAVWAAIVPLVPALIVLVERAQARLPAWARERPPALTEDGATGPVVSALGGFVRRAAAPIVAGAALVALVAAAKLPGFLRDPWEYNFARLGSTSSKQQGAGVWSRKANDVFGGKMNVASAMMLADRPEQVPLLKARILSEDAADPKGRLVSSVTTLGDLLPGTPDEQAKKLEVLARMRRRLTPRVLARLPAADRARVEAARPPDGLAPVAPADLPPLLRRRFEEANGTLGTVFYVKYRNDVSFSDGRVLLRMAHLTSNVELPDGSVVTTASRSTVFAEMIRSMERDGPLATFASLLAVTLVVILATGSPLGTLAVVGSLSLGVLLMVGAMAYFDVKLNFLNFIALPITFGIGCEYPFNLFDRTRLLGGDVDAAVRRSAGPVALCSYTTTLGYGSLAFADNQALRSFGKVAAFGELACAFSALVVLPAVLHLLTRSPRLRAALMRGLFLRGPSSLRGPPSLRGPASRGPASARGPGPSP